MTKSILSELNISNDMGTYLVYKQCRICNCFGLVNHKINLLIHRSLIIMLGLHLNFDYHIYIYIYINIYI